MYSHNFHTTNSNFNESNLINPFQNKENVDSYILATTKVFDAIKNSLLIENDKIVDSAFFEATTEAKPLYASNLINTSSFFWVSCAAEQFLTSISVNSSPEKRLSTEIVKRYSLSENVQKIYFSQVSFYVDIDVLMTGETISDNELDKFFDYEQQLLDMFDIPINFNYRQKNSFYLHSENNVLIFDK